MTQEEIDEVAYSAKHHNRLDIQHALDTVRKNSRSALEGVITRALDREYIEGDELFVVGLLAQIGYSATVQTLQATNQEAL